jgi:hypothetical protein
MNGRTLMLARVSRVLCKPNPSVHLIHINITRDTRVQALVEFELLGQPHNSTSRCRTYYSVIFCKRSILL